MRSREFVKVVEEESAAVMGSTWISMNRYWRRPVQTFDPSRHVDFDLLTDG